MAWITETFAKYTVMSWVIFKNFNNRPFKLFIKITQQLWGTRTFCYLEQLHLINCFIKKNYIFPIVLILILKDNFFGFISCWKKNTYFILYLMLFLCVNLLTVLFWRFRDTDNYYQYSFFFYLAFNYFRATNGNGMACLLFTQFSDGGSTLMMIRLHSKINFVHLLVNNYWDVYIHF